MVKKVTIKSKCINWWNYQSSKTWNKKKQEGWFLGAFLALMATSPVSPVTTSFVKDVFGKRVMWAGRG